MAKMTTLFYVAIVAAAGVGGYLYWRKRQPPIGLPDPSINYQPGQTATSTTAQSPSTPIDPVPSIPWGGPGDWDVSGTGAVVVRSTTADEAAEAREQQDFFERAMCMAYGGIWCARL